MKKDGAADSSNYGSVFMQGAHRAPGSRQMEGSQPCQSSSKESYCTARYVVRQVRTLGAGGRAGAPGLARNVPSATMQKFRTPLWLNAIGAELPTKSIFVVAPPLAKPAANNWYPLLIPVLSLSSRMQAVAADGEQGSAPPRLMRLGANPIWGYAT